VSRTPRDYVFWFLPELISTVTWAGDPAKSVVHGPLGDRLAPRKSFAPWTEMVERRSRPWTSIEIESATSLRTAILDVVLRQLDKVAQRTEQLEAANRELDDFAYVASHDLKAPLRVIDNASKWLEEDLAAHLDDETRDTMRLLRGRVKRMEKLLDDLLQYSRVGRTVEPASDGMVAGNDLIDDILALVSPPEAFKVTVGPGFAAIRLRRMPLQQILMNLIGNAIKHHDRKEGRIELEVGDRGGLYAFAVKDDGPGIAAEFHDEIFRIFRTLKPRDQVEGSGMGLAIVRKHIDTAGGALWLESAEGEGSTFRFTWPKPQEESRP
jgi:light-regulated signal transduction histidine kinase (bacteriophytochrome)